MSTFTLAISRLTTSNLPWFMELTFRLPMQYCSLQPRTLLLSPVPSTTGCCFCFGSIPLFFLELFLLWSPVAYWAPTDLGSSSFSILSFCLLILFMGFSRQEYWSALPFPSPADQWSWISLFKPKETLSTVRSGLGNSCGCSCSERFRILTLLSIKMRPFVSALLSCIGLQHVTTYLKKSGCW